MTMPQQPDGAVYDGRYPLVGLKIVRDFLRPKPEIIEVFRDKYVPEVAGLVGALYCVNPAIRPAYEPMPRLLGTAVTVRVPPGDNLMVKVAIRLAKPGDVIVVDAGGHVNWCLGGAGMCMAAKQRGVVGMVIDGAYRDIREVQGLEFPLFCKGSAPATGPKRGPGMINVPVHCGGVIVQPGDIVLGDPLEGIVVVPKDAVEMVAQHCQGLAKPKLSTEDWDLEKMAKNARETKEYYEAVLEYRDCQYIDWVE